MNAGVVETQAKPGKTDDLVAGLEAALPEIGQIAGIKQLITLDMGNDNGLPIAPERVSRGLLEPDTPHQRRACRRVPVLSGVWNSALKGVPTPDECAVERTIWCGMSAPGRRQSRDRGLDRSFSPLQSALCLNDASIHQPR